MRTTKAKNCVKGSGWACRKDCLLVYRLFAALVLVVIWIHDFIRAVKKMKYMGLQYFTQWGVHLTTAYFLLASITSLRYRGRAEEIRDSSS